MGSFEENVKKINEAYNCIEGVPGRWFANEKKMKFMSDYRSILTILGKIKNGTELEDKDKKKLNDFIDTVKDIETNVAKNIEDKKKKDEFLEQTKNLYDGLNEFITGPKADVEKADKNDDPSKNLNQNMSEQDEEIDNNNHTEDNKGQVNSEIRKIHTYVDDDQPEINYIKPLDNSGFFMKKYGKKLIELGKKQNWNSSEYNDLVFSVNVYANERKKHPDDRKWKLKTIKTIRDRLHTYMSKVEKRDEGAHNGVNSEKYKFCKEFEKEFNEQFKEELGIIHKAEEKVEKQKEEKLAQKKQTQKDLENKYGTFFIGY